MKPWQILIILLTGLACASCSSSASSFDWESYRERVEDRRQLREEARMNRELADINRQLAYDARYYGK